MFTMTFDFGNREMTDIAFVNETLATMKLSDLRVEEIAGYLKVRIVYEEATDIPKEISYQYGLDHLVLECSEDEDEALYSWRIDTCAVSRRLMDGSHTLQDSWRRTHPGCAVRALLQLPFSDADAFVVLYHEAA